jgi:hypothetical protein
MAHHAGSLIPRDFQLHTAAIIGHIIRKPEPISGPTANVITAPERNAARDRRQPTFTRSAGLKGRT